MSSGARILHNFSEKIHTTYNKIDKEKDVIAMNRKAYRICLIMIIMAAVVSGIFYYRLTQKKELDPNEGIFVWKDSFPGAPVGSEAV